MNRWPREQQMPQWPPTQLGLSNATQWHPTDEHSQQMPNPRWSSLQNPPPSSSRGIPPWNPDHPEYPELSCNNQGVSYNSTFQRMSDSGGDRELELRAVRELPVLFQRIFENFRHGFLDSQTPQQLSANKNPLFQPTGISIQSRAAAFQLRMNPT
jgi:hypothetical protein